MVKGICNCAYSQGGMKWPRKLSLMNRDGKTFKDFDLVCSGNSFKERIVAKSNAVAVLGVPIPCPNFIVKCVSTNCCLTGSHCSSKVSHEMILFGSKTISKCFGSWEEQWEQRIWVSSLSVLLLSQERALAKLLLVPQNHWLYSLILFER